MVECVLGCELVGWSVMRVVKKKRGKKEERRFFFSFLYHRQISFKKKVFPLDFFWGKRNIIWAG
jgi:hypothetical protein